MLYYCYIPSWYIIVVILSYSNCYIHLYPSIWVNYNELTTSSLEIIVSQRNHPQMAARFRLVNYYNLPRSMSILPSILSIYHQYFGVLLIQLAVCRHVGSGLLADGGQGGDPPTPAGEPGRPGTRSKRSGGWKKNHAHRYP